MLKKMFGSSERSVEDIEQEMDLVVKTREGIEKTYKQKLKQKFNYLRKGSEGRKLLEARSEEEVRRVLKKKTRLTGESLEREVEEILAGKEVKGELGDALVEAMGGRAQQNQTFGKSNPMFGLALERLTEEGVLPPPTEELKKPEGFDKVIMKKMEEISKSQSIVTKIEVDQQRVAREGQELGLTLGDLDKYVAEHATYSDEERSIAEQLKSKSPDTARPDSYWRQVARKQLTEKHSGIINRNQSQIEKYHQVYDGKWIDQGLYATVTPDVRVSKSLKKGRSKSDHILSKTRGKMSVPEVDQSRIVGIEGPTSTPAPKYKAAPPPAPKHKAPPPPDREI